MVWPDFGFGAGFAAGVHVGCLGAGGTARRGAGGWGAGAAAGRSGARSTGRSGGAAGATAAGGGGAAAGTTGGGGGAGAAAAVSTGGGGGGIRLVAVALGISAGRAGAALLPSEPEWSQLKAPIIKITTAPAPSQSAAFGLLLKLTSLKSSEGAGRRCGAMATARGAFAITSVRCCTATGAVGATGAACGAATRGWGWGAGGGCCVPSVPEGACAAVAYATSAAMARSTITELAGSSCMSTVAGAGAWVPLRAWTAPRTSADVSTLGAARTSASATVVGSATGAASSSHEGRKLAASRSASSGFRLPGATPGPLPPGFGGSVGKATGESLTPHRHPNNVRSGKRARPPPPAYCPNSVRRRSSQSSATLPTVSRRSSNSS